MPDPTSSTPSWETRLRDTAAHAEQDLRRLVTYLNDEVVPDVRRHGSHALRAAAQELERLARHMDDAAGSPPPGPSPASPDPSAKP